MIKQYIFNSFREVKKNIVLTVETIPEVGAGSVIKDITITNPIADVELLTENSIIAIQHTQNKKNILLV